MATISKSVNGIFVLNSEKISEFLTKKVPTSSDAIRRFEERKTKTEKIDIQNKKLRNKNHKTTD